MRMSQLFSETFRETPADILLVGHQLLLRAGYIRQIEGEGIVLLPLGMKVVQAIQSALTKRLSYHGCQELRISSQAMPTSPIREKITQLNPSPVQFASESLANIGLLLGGMLHSHRQLPRSLFQIHTVVRDDERNNAAFFYPHQDIQLSTYHLAANDLVLREELKIFQDALKQFCDSMGVETRMIEASLLEEPSQQVNQTVFLHPLGAETVYLCTHCDYAAHNLTARISQTNSKNQSVLPFEDVATPNIKTIEELSAFLGIAKAQTAKAVFFMAELSGRTKPLFIFALLRGDLALNEFKLKRIIQRHTHEAVTSLTPATEADIRHIGAIPGYASPMGITHENVLLIADDSIPISANLVAGSNREGFHRLNTNYERDYIADVIGDIALAENGGSCPQCGQAMTARSGFTLARTWLAGSSFGEALGVHFQTEEGTSCPLALATTEVSLLPLLAAVAETHHDDHGLTLPVGIAPYWVHLVMLGESAHVMQTAQEIEVQLSQHNVACLWDDRDERAGVKFNDADLIGVPIRLTISERSLERGGVEMKLRFKDEREIVPLPGIVKVILRILKTLSTVDQP